MRSRLLTLCLIALFSPLSGATSDALQAFKSEMRAQVLQDIKQVPKNAFVRVWLHSSAEPIEGQFKYYRAYDYKLWIKLDNKFFVRAYDLDDIVAVKVIIRHSV